MKTFIREELAATYEEAIAQLQLELDQVIMRNLAVPLQPGGWWHQYVCPEHHTELLFDPLQDDADVFYCTHGCVLSGEPYRGAWLVFKHQAMARYALQAAAVYASTRNPKYGNWGRQLIVQYAKQFPIYPIHPDAKPWMLKGRAFHQALTEAIWATTLIRAYLNLSDQGVSFAQDSAVIDPFLRMLGRSMEQYHYILTVERGEVENNYTAWLNAALCCVYAAEQNKDKLEKHVYGPGGLHEHLSCAIRGDGFEFEGSVYYHLFVLRAYMIAAEMLGRFGIEGYFLQGKDGQSLEKMLHVLVLLADEKGQLPAFHDGPYERLPYTREIVEVLEIGYAHFGQSSYLPLLKAAYESAAAAGRAAGLEEQYGNPALLEAVLYGCSERASKHQMSKMISWKLEESGFARLQHPDNPLACLLDFGPHGGNHGHFDKLNLMLYDGRFAVSPDPGTVPYGSELKKNWYPHTVSHNTVTVGGQSQNPSAARCTCFAASSDQQPENGKASISLEASEAYEGARLRRHVLITEDWVIDWYNVELSNNNIIDWTFHFCGEIAGLSDSWQPISAELSLGESDGYNYVKAVHSYSEQKYDFTSSSKTASTVIQYASDLDPEQLSSLSVSLLLPAEARLLHITSPGLAVDPSAAMNGFLARCLDDQADFVAVYRSGSKPCTIELAKDNRTLVVGDENKSMQYVCTVEGIKELTK